MNFELIVIAILAFAGIVVAVLAVKIKRLRTSPFRPMPEKFDLFVSYKSENVTVIRPLVDRLLALGYKIWFNEYVVLLNDQDRFQELVNDGINNSVLFVAFTNDLYSHSKHTRDDELRIALARKELRQLLQVKLPDERLTYSEFPSLAALPQDQVFTASASPDSMSQVCDFLERHLQRFAPTQAESSALPLAPLSDATARPALTVEGYGVHLSAHFTGWSQKSPSRGFPGVLDFWGPVYQRDFGQAKMEMQVGFWLDPSVARKAPSATSVRDREIYEQLLKFASRYEKKWGTMDCQGVHLFFWRNYSHLILTYWNQKTSEWSRRYSLIVPNPWLPSRNMELAIVFSSRCHFNTFCQFGEHLDALASSIGWDLGTLSQSLEWMTPEESVSSTRLPLAKIMGDGKTVNIGNEVIVKLPDGWCLRIYPGLKPANMAAILSPLDQDEEFPRICIQKSFSISVRDDGYEFPDPPSDPRITSAEIMASGRRALLVTYHDHLPKCREVVVQKREHYLTFRLEADDFDACCLILDRIVESLAWKDSS